MFAGVRQAKVLPALVGLLLFVTLLNGGTSRAEESDTPTEAGAGFVPTPYTRAFDTTAGIGGPAQALTASATRSFKVAGAFGVPAEGVRAVALDVTVKAFSGQGSGSLTIWPTGQSRPDGPAITFDTALTPVTNTVLVPVGEGGQVTIANAGGTVQANVDVQGYFADGQGGGFRPAAATVVNSATNQGTSDGPFVGNASRRVQVAEAGGSIPLGATAVYAHVMVSGGTGSGSVKLVSGDAPVDQAQVAAMYQAGETRSVGMTIPLDASGQMLIKNYSPAGVKVNVRVDVQGYFTPDGAFGFKPTGQKLVGGATGAGGQQIPGGGTLELEVGGEHGLPQYGVAAAVLTLRVNKWSSSGSLKVHGRGLALPATSQLLFYGSSNSPLTTTAFVTPGTLGRVVLKNTSSQPVTVSISVQGWFPAERLIPEEEEADFREEMRKKGTDSASVELALWNREYAERFYYGIESEATGGTIDPNLADSELSRVIREIAALEGESEAEVREGLSEMPRQPGQTAVAQAQALLDMLKQDAEAVRKDGAAANARSAPGGDGGRTELPIATHVGDIAYSPNVTRRIRHGHAAIYASPLVIIHAPGGQGKGAVVAEVPKARLAGSFARGAKLMSVHTNGGKGRIVSSAKRKRAVAWARSRIGDKYRPWYKRNAFVVKGRVGTPATAQNCSQLVYAAYVVATGYKLNPLDQPVMGLPAVIHDRLYVTPRELLQSPYTRTYKPRKKK